MLRGFFWESRVANDRGNISNWQSREERSSDLKKTHLDRPHLERIVQLVESGAVRPPEITIYPLSEAIAAHKVSEGRHLRGKLVFKVR